MNMQLASMQKMSKGIGIVFVLAVALGVTIYGGGKAANYFAKASSCSAQKVATAQVTANSAVISWETQDISQGRVEYGTSPNSLTFTAPEAASGKIHNIPLTLLTPNTVYYYLIAIGNNRCDSGGQTCSGDSCVPWSFTTSAVSLPPQITAVTPIVREPTVTPPVSAIVTTVPTSTTSAVTPEGQLSSYCWQVKGNIGASTNSPTWGQLQQYDVDSNGIINGLDVIKCQKSGK